MVPLLAAGADRRPFLRRAAEQDYKTAYGIWMHDPQWQQHPGKYPKYPYNEFYRDWGPGGEWGLIKTQKVYGASTCPWRVAAAWLSMSS